jgi:hypothetical protein
MSVLVPQADSSSELVAVSSFPYRASALKLLSSMQEVVNMSLPTLYNLR